jgi:hypothetical protein
MPHHYGENLRELTADERAWFDRNAALVGEIAGVFAGRYRMTPDEAVASTYYCLYRAALNWDPDAGANEKTYIYSFCRYGLMNEANLLRYGTSKFRAGKAAVLFSDLTEKSASEIAGSVEVGEFEELDAVRLHAAIGGLSELQQAVLRARLRGEKLAAIGRRIGMTKERVRQVEHVAVWRLRITLGEDPGPRPTRSRVDGNRASLFTPSARSRRLQRR